MGVESYESSDEHDDYANGFKSRKVKTGTGQLNLEISQVRNASSQFSLTILEGQTRSEKAMRIDIAEMYIQGVSNRKVKSIVK